MSSRTRNALLTIPELRELHFGAHRSHQIGADDVEWADVILASEAEHVRFVRAQFQGANDKTVQLCAFVQLAPVGVSFADQLSAVSRLEPSSTFDVIDPAGGDQADYDACASELWHLANAFALLAGESDRP